MDDLCKVKWSQILYNSTLTFFLNRANRRKEPKKLLTPATDQNGSQVNFYYGAPTPYAESIAPSHHSTYAHYYDDEEDGWEMPNFYNETYMKESLHNGMTMNGKMNSLARSNASIYGTKDDLYDRLKRHAYPGKKGKRNKLQLLRILFLTCFVYLQIKVTATAKVSRR